MKVIRKIALITGLCNLAAIAHGLLYGFLTVFPTLEPADLKLFLIWEGASFLLSYLSAPLVLYFSFHSIEQVIALGDEARVSSALLEEARRKTINLPIYATRISTYTWVLVALSIVPIYMYFRPDNPVWTALHVSVVTILIGTVSGVFIYYVTEWYSRRNLLPLLTPADGLSKVPGATAPTIQFKILMLIVTTCAMPVMVLTVAAVIGTVTAGAIIYLGVSFVALGMLQGIAISRSISRPIQNVLGEMARVRDGDLGAKAQVLSVDNVGHLSEGFNEMVEGLRRAELIRDSFGRYVSREVLEKVLSGDVTLEGELREATVMFSDIRDFTAISEKMPPVELLAQLNGYLDIMVDTVVAFGGRVDKFIGDSVMVVFGIPLAQKDHALRAVKAGLEMFVRLEEWNAGLDKSKYSAWRMGIGIHSGVVIAGNIGSAKKMEYAVIGDVVNTAARIEQLDKVYNAGLIVSEQTYQLVSGEVKAKRLDTVILKGKTEPITVYQITGLKE